MRGRKRTKSKVNPRHHSGPRSVQRKKQVVARSGQQLAKAGRKMKPSLKMGDKLYLVTRRDLAPGYQGVQSCHAIRQFSADHPDQDLEWFKVSNTLAWLSVDNEIELMRLLINANDKGLKWSAFREPDVGGAITAIAIESHPDTVQLCKNLTPALRELT